MADHPPEPETSPFRRTLLTGFLIILPLGVTLWIVQLVFGSVDRTMTPFIVRTAHVIGLGDWSTVAWVQILLPIFSLVLAVLLIWAVGLIGGNVIGRQVVDWLEKLMHQIPIVRGIYSATRQFVDTFSKGDARAFSRVVLVEWPLAGSWTLGLVTNEPSGEISEKLGDVISVYVPTTPNPTGGYLVFVKEDRVKTVNMSVDEAMKTIISLGVLE